MIQTYRPDHYSVIRAAAQDYEAFYEEEVLYRELGAYPPVSHMLAVLITTPDEKRGEALADKLASLAREEADRDKQISKEAQKHELGQAVVIGPSKASIGKINDIYRFVLYCKSSDYRKLTAIKDRIEQAVALLERKDENIQFDFDPIDRY